MDPLIGEMVEPDSAVSDVPTIVLAEGSKTPLRAAQQLAEKYHMKLVDLAVTNVDPDLSRSVPLHVLEHVCAIPFAFDGTSLRVAIADPQNVRVGRDPVGDAPSGRVLRGRARRCADRATAR